MRYFQIPIEGNNQFSKSYSIYLVEIKNEINNKIYYYIGQTERPPIVRLAGHLEATSWSRQNRIYQSLKDKISELGCNSVDNFLDQSDITMNVFPIDENIRTNINKLINQIEYDFIQNFKYKFDEELKYLLNDKGTGDYNPKYSSDESKDIADEIINKIIKQKLINLITS